MIIRQDTRQRYVMYLHISSENLLRLAAAPLADSQARLLPRDFQS